jgi:hypothetical protein
MKIKILTLGLLTIANFVFQNSFAGTEIEDLNQQTIDKALALNEVQPTIVILPDIENLWPHHPQSYFQSVRRAARNLGGATTNSNAVSMLLTLFSNMIQKPLPTNDGLAVPCLEKKDEIVLYYLNFPEVTNDKSKLLAIAKYIGEIRTQIIPNFVPKTVYLNPPGVMDSSPEKVRQAIRENEQNKSLNSFQQALRIANNRLTFNLLHNCFRFPVSDPRNTGFIKDVSDAAHLTEDEQRQLQ